MKPSEQRDSNASDRTKRRVFGVRSRFAAFATIVIIAAVVATCYLPGRDSRLAIRDLAREGLPVYYDFQLRPDGSIDEGAQPRVPPSIVRLLGVEWFGDAVAFDGAVSAREVDDHVLELVGRLPKFQMILAGPNTTDAGLRSIQHLRHLQFVAVESNHVTDDGVAYLANQGELEYLSLASTKLHGRGLCSLSQCTSLRSLDLSKSGLDDSAAPCLRKLTSLHRLDLFSTKVSDHTLEAIRELPFLEILTVQDTTVTDSGVDMLQRYRPECLVVY